VQHPDFDASFSTGMTRRHWEQAGLYLLEGVFQHVKSFDDPIALPKRPGKTYPQPDDPPWKFRSAEFEGLSRTLMVAGPIIEADPDAQAGGYNLRDYYANLILRATDPSSDLFVGRITDMVEEYNQPLFQHTAEGAALALGLTYTRKTIWDRFSQSQRDQVLDLLDDYVHNRTNSHNWRFFNVMMASFLAINGRDIDRTILGDHLQNLLAYYAGDGWYRDMGSFDYYSCWAFQFYGPIWCRMYGYEQMPEVARIIEQRHGELMHTYGRMFGRDGHSLMWGRSIIYRCAASAPFPAAFLLNETPADPGWSRRICSGNLLQFLTRDDVFVDGVPSLGFYRTFEPLVQAYSCAISPFWLAKVFLALHLPADSPFWTAPETDGEWDTLGNGSQTTVLPGPGLAMTMHGKAETAEIRPGKVDGKKSNPNYTRLVYNSAFLWEADSDDGATAATYSVQQIGYDLPFMAGGGPRFVGWRDGVLYRQIDLPGWLARVDLADIPVPGGVVRVDRVSIPYAHQLHLGHFGLPHLPAPPTVDPLLAGPEGQYPGLWIRGDLRGVILVAYAGWDGVDTMVHRELNAEAPESTVAYCHRRDDKDYQGMFLAVTAMLHSTGNNEIPPNELDPLAELEPLDWAPSGHPCGARVALKDGREMVIDFGHAMGKYMT
jgi:hypothetical protein